MTYDGGKNGAGVYQTIINQMPPHRVYIEAFLGSGAILRRKRPAKINIGIEIDDVQFAAVQRFLSTVDRTQNTFEIYNNSAEFVLREWPWNYPAGKDVLIYADPPYLMETRSCQRDLYRHEFSSASDHTRLIELAKSIPALWMISGYRSALYDDLLRDWRRVDFQAMTRRGLVTESLWCNFPDPVELHDYRFLGSDNTERQRIARKKATWTNRLRKMPILERQAVLAAIRSVEAETVCTDRRAQTNSASRDPEYKTNCTAGRADESDFTR